MRISVTLHTPWPPGSPDSAALKGGTKPRGKPRPLSTVTVLTSEKLMSGLDYVAEGMEEEAGPEEQLEFTFSGQ